MPTGFNIIDMKKLKEHIIDYNQDVISIKGLCKSFGPLDVLKNIDFQLFRGENIAVLGKSGSGKSVLIKLMIGLLKADRGSIRILNKEVTNLNNKELDELRLKIGFSFQNSALYDSMNIYENLAFPLKMNCKTLGRKEISYSIHEVLNAVGLADKVNNMPADLSGGQQKRIGIARTLILKPEIMLYDEPTSGLDPITSGGIIDLINDVQQQYNTSSVIITHDLVCAKNTSDRITMLIDGHFSKPGKFNEIFDTTEQQIADFYNYNFIKQ